MNNFNLSVHFQFELEDKVAHHSKEDKEPEQDQNVDPIHLKMSYDSIYLAVIYSQNPIMNQSNPHGKKMGELHGHWSS